MESKKEKYAHLPNPMSITRQFESVIYGTVPGLFISAAPAALIGLGRYSELKKTNKTEEEIAEQIFNDVLPFLVAGASAGAITSLVASSTIGVAADAALKSGLIDAIEEKTVAGFKKIQKALTPHFKAASQNLNAVSQKVTPHLSAAADKLSSRTISKRFENTARGLSVGLALGLVSEAASCAHDIREDINSSPLVKDANGEIRPRYKLSLTPPSGHLLGGALLLGTAAGAAWPVRGRKEENDLNTPPPPNP